jgi:hypothetical protein
MRGDHDFTNSHFTSPIAIRPGFDSKSNSGQAIAVAVSVSQEDQPLTTNFEVAALMMLGLVAIGLPSIFEALIR